MLKPTAEEAVIQLKVQARRRAREDKARKAQVWEKELSETAMLCFAPIADLACTKLLIKEASASGRAG